MSAARHAVSTGPESMPSTQHAYDHVAGIFFPIAIAVFACVVITLGVLLVLGARRRTPGPAQRGRPAGGRSTRSCSARPSGVLVWITFTAETPIDRLVSRPALQVNVVAAQWSWTFRYANGTTVERGRHVEPAGRGRAGRR